MKRCTYILPTNFAHEGIRLKVEGQLQALKKHFNISLHALHYSKQQSKFRQLLEYFFYEFRTCFVLLFTPVLYIRYNPKLLFGNMLLPFFSYFKTIYVEHNTLMDTELIFLKRPFEHRIHRFTLGWFRFGNMTHIAVNNQLKEHLEGLGLTRVTYIQNGYKAPDVSPDLVDQEIMDTFHSFKSSVTHCAIFTGNGYPWHGLTEIIEYLRQFPDIGLVVVGPYDISSSKQILSIQHCLSPTLVTLIESCDFAISTFRWDMLEITEGSPLKSRQFLCHGCPILVNYHDCAADFEELKPYIVDFREHKEHSFSRISQLIVNKKDLIKNSRSLLSWDCFFDTLLS